MDQEESQIKKHDLNTSAGGRAYVAEFFAKRLRRYDFERYISERLAADFACALAQYLCGVDAALPPSEMEQVPWRCFHCDEVFNDREAAALHFGTSLMHEPACQIDIAKYREMEETVRRYNEEDTDLHREIHGLQARHQAELRREEKTGYAQGLRDQKAETLRWAVRRWEAEVSLRPLTNVHRRSLDDTWRQVARHLGGDDVALLGARHGDLLASAAAPSSGDQA